MYLGTDFDIDLQLFYDSMYTTNIGSLDDVAQLSYSDPEHAIVVNTSITPENLSEENQQIVNDIYLNKWAVDDFEFDEYQKNVLLNIAYQNPISGGEAVYDARVMLFLDADDYYFDQERTTNTCIAENYQRSGKIIPNPNNGTMIFVYELLKDEKGKLEIFDVKGRVLKEYLLSNNQSFQNIELNGTSSGIYFYRFTINNQIILIQNILYRFDLMQFYFNIFFLSFFLLYYR